MDLINYYLRYCAILVKMKLRSKYVNTYKKRLHRLQTAYLLEMAANEANSLIGQSVKKPLFIDCGSNIGQAWEIFSRYFPISNYDHVLIEPNPYCLKILKSKINLYNSNGSIKLINKAASAKNGHAKLLLRKDIHEDNTSQAATIHNYNNTSPDLSNGYLEIIVETFRFSELIVELALNYYPIIVKMDVESAEYEILEDMIENKMAGLINVLLVEFHSQYMDDFNKKKFEVIEKTLIRSLSRQGCRVFLWY
jgi:FkbM family methyltransferase